MASTVIDLNKYELVPELSVYNLNYYKHKSANTKSMIKRRTFEKFDFFIK